MKNIIISLIVLLSSISNAQNYEGVWQDVENKNLIMIINKISYDNFKIKNYDLENEVFTNETFLNSYQGMTTYYQDYTEKISYELNYLILNDKMHCYNELELASVYKKIN